MARRILSSVPQQSFTQNLEVYKLREGIESHLSVNERLETSTFHNPNQAHEYRLNLQQAKELEFEQIT